MFYLTNGVKNLSNVFSFTGTLGRDAELRYTPNSIAILQLTVANNVGFGDKQKTNWVRVSLFGKRAEGQLKDYLKKGQQVFVSVELSTTEYTDKNGINKTVLELNANTVDLIGKREQSAPPPQPAPVPQPVQQPQAYAPQQMEDDIPF